jgi:hypothetical protein
MLFVLIRMPSTKLSLVESIDLLKRDYEKYGDDMGLERNIPAIESLETPEEIQKYFQELVGVTADAVDKARVSNPTDLTKRIDNGERTLNGVATSLAYDRVSYILKSFEDETIPQRWSEALPELKNTFWGLLG